MAILFTYENWAIIIPDLCFPNVFSSSIINRIFIQAGSETTSTTLSWAVLFMALNPDVQEKAQV